MDKPTTKSRKLQKPDYENISPGDREVMAKGKLEINSEHKLRSENLPFDIDVVCTNFSEIRPSFPNFLSGIL